MAARTGDGSSDPELVVGGEQTINLYDLRDGTLVYAATTHTRPGELFAADGTQLTSVCDDFVAGGALSEVERFTATSADGTQVDAWLVRPPDFDEGKRYPVRTFTYRYFDERKAYGMCS